MENGGRVSVCCPELEPGEKVNVTGNSLQAVLESIEKRISEVTADMEPFTIELDSLKAARKALAAVDGSTLKNGKPKREKKDYVPMALTADQEKKVIRSIGFTGSGNYMKLQIECKLHGPSLAQFLKGSPLVHQMADKSWGLTEAGREAFKAMMAEPEKLAG